MSNRIRLPREVSEWLLRRRRFREEWEFHREMAVSEYEALGLTHREARRLAGRRLGSYFAYRGSSLRQFRARLIDLPDLLPWRAIRRSALFGPAVALLTFTALLLPNPHRLEVLANAGSLAPFLPHGQVERFVPLTPPGVVPMALDDVLLWGLVVAGLASVAGTPKIRRRLRVWIFAAGTLVIFAVLSAAFWATGLQLLMKNRWQSDGVQGLVIAAFCLVHIGSTLVAFQSWRRDLLGRCPICLRRLGMAEERGKSADLLIAPLERETICIHGHGLNVESRWSQSFEVGPASLV